MQEVIGNFKVVKKLGEGGMGEVYKGIDTVLEREVAIKMLRPELSSQPEILERFRTEAVALARLNDPSIAMLYAFHQDAGHAYMVMEFVAGETLADVMKREGRIAPPKALKLIAQVLRGLEHAHAKDIVHRDIKPSNMMLTENGEPKLMDFGIARILERSRLTRTGYLIGTLQYMSPEQVQGREADPRSDLYSIGIVLYEMVTGRIPFDKTTDYEIIRAQVEEAPKPPSEWLPNLEPAIERAILKALQKNPADRFGSAGEFRETLLEIYQDLYQDGGSKTLGTDRRPAPKTRVTDVPLPGPIRLRPAHVLIGAGVFAALLGLVFWFGSGRGTVDEANNRSPDWLPPGPIEQKLEPDPLQKDTQEGSGQETGEPAGIGESGLPDRNPSQDTGTPVNTGDQKSAGAKRPDFTDPVQKPQVDLNSIGIAPTVEVVKDEPAVVSKTTRKSRSQTRPKRSLARQPREAPAPDKPKDWSKMDFGESYE